VLSMQVSTGGITFTTKSLAISTPLSNNKFIFTVTDLARFLGKSPVTLRGWDRQGLVQLPRDKGGDRKLGLEDVRTVTQVAYDLNRINKYRWQLINATLTMLMVIERENR
jgi:hypothetical protein